MAAKPAVRVGNGDTNEVNLVVPEAEPLMGSRSQGYSDNYLVLLPRQQIWANLVRLATDQAEQPRTIIDVVFSSFA